MGLCAGLQAFGVDKLPKLPESLRLQRFRRFSVERHEEESC